MDSLLLDILQPGFVAFLEDTISLSNRNYFTEVLWFMPSGTHREDGHSKPYC